MARVRFTADFDWSPVERPRVTIAYKQGMELTVRRSCCDAAVAAGKAYEVVPEPADPVVSTEEGEGE